LKSCQLVAALALFGVLVASHSPAEEPPDDEVPLCDALMASVRAQLPRDPLTLSGELIVRRRRGVVVRKHAFEIDLEWGRNPPRATYTLRDLFGTDLEALTVEREPGGGMRLSYARGDPLQPAPIPDLFAPIRKTDLSWTDLTLSFLWWKGGSVLGMEKILNFPCYVVRVPAPSGSKGAYTHVRLWIHRKMHVLLRAEGYAGERLVRRLWVKSVKKVKGADKDDDRWMVKDMEIQSYPARQRTKLRIHDVATKPAT